MTYAYHVLCIACAKTKKVCPKCLEEKPIAVDAIVAEQLKVNEAEALERLRVSSMRLRDKIGMLREFEKGAISAYDIMVALNGSLMNEKEENQMEESEVSDGKQMEEDGMSDEEEVKETFENK